MRRASSRVWLTERPPGDGSIAVGIKLSGRRRAARRNHNTRKMPFCVLRHTFACSSEAIVRPNKNRE
jgi:hypothetical protein